MNSLTLNTHAWMEENPMGKLEDIASVIAQGNFEVIALQEINQSMDAEEVEDDTFIPASGETTPVPIKKDNFAWLLVKLLREKGESYYWSWTATHIGYDEYDEGIAILMRRPFTSESILVSKSTDYNCHYTRRILKANATFADRDWTVFSAHYSWWKDDEGEALFSYEWEKTLPHIERNKGKAILFMGDLNNEANVKAEGYELIQQTAPYLKDTFEVADERVGSSTVLSAIDGWENQGGEKRIDYIWSTFDDEVVEYRVMFDGKNGPIVSDHFGVAVKLKL